ncbi:hypothetical protein [Flavobacterium columnare]|nr:hypothetical protein [Flavobacterium columnare]
MGLDIVIYKNDAREVLEIKEKVHKEIYRGKIDLSEMILLPMLSDYYKTNVFYDSKDIQKLIVELSSISSNMDFFIKNEINQIIEKISAPDISKIHIAGD